MLIGYVGMSWKEKYLLFDIIFEVCNEVGYEYELVDLICGNGFFENFCIKGVKGMFGVIYLVSVYFCDSCNWFRFIVDGYIKVCLYWDEEMNICLFI